VKRGKALARLETKAAHDLSRLGEANARLQAMHTAVAEVTEGIDDWLNGDMACLGSTTHDYARGEMLARHLVTLLEMLIEADRAAGGNGTGDANEFRAARS
jgi:hypothetical protein